MSFEIQSESNILTRLKANLAAALNCQSSIEGTFNSDMLTANAIEFEQAYAELALAMQANFADTSWGNYLTARAAEFGVIRKEATQAKGQLLIKGTSGSTIISRSLFSTVQGNKFYSLANSVIGVDGTVTIDIIAADSGTVGNVEANTINNIPMSIPGVISCINPAATYDGFEEETDADLLSRYLLKVRTPATSGNQYHYLQWAESVEGVGSAKIIPLWNGNGTVKVIIVNADNETASTDLIKKVTDYIEQYRPIGATVTVTSPAPKTIDISADVKGSFDLDTIKKNINAYFKNNGFNMTYVSIAQIGRILLDTNTVTDYSNLKLNNGTENISITTEELPTCGTVALNVLS